MRRFEFTEGSSNKFWQVQQQGASLLLQWGKIGTNGQSQTKDFAGDAKAKSEADKLIAEKKKKGYVEVTPVAGSAGAVASPTNAAPTTTAPNAKPEPKPKKSQPDEK